LSLLLCPKRVVRHLEFFFFSSRRRHTSSKRDWSSDVCSSDLHSVCLHIWITHLFIYPFSVLFIFHVANLHDALVCFNQIADRLNVGQAEFFLFPVFMQFVFDKFFQFVHTT